MRMQVLPDGELIAHAVLAIDLISYAHDVPSNISPRLNSLPGSIYDDRYDIEAKACPNAITTTSQEGEIQLIAEDGKNNCVRFLGTIPNAQSLIHFYVFRFLGVQLSSRAYLTIAQ
jgi:hypothetical protein